MNVCSICSHKERSGIDAALTSQSASAAAAAYGVSVQSVRRHKRNGHVPGAPGTTRSTTGSSPNTSGDPLDVMQEALDSLRAMDPGRISPAAQVARIDAIRRTAESIQKQKPAATPSSIAWREVPELRTLLGVLARNLEAVACPECGHHSGPALRATIARDMKEEGI